MGKSQKPSSNFASVTANILPYYDGSHSNFHALAESAAKRNLKEPPEVPQADLEGYKKQHLSRIPKRRDSNKLTRPRLTKNPETIPQDQPPKVSTQQPKAAISRLGVNLPKSDALAASEAHDIGQTDGFKRSLITGLKIANRDETSNKFDGRPKKEVPQAIFASAVTRKGYEPTDQEQVNALQQKVDEQRAAFTSAERLALVSAPRDRGGTSR